MNDPEYRRLDLTTKQWAAVVGVQMHFNDMIQKLRQMAAPVILAAYGFSVTIYTGAHPAQTLRHAVRAIEWRPALIVGFALLFSAAAYVTDWYYYPMLKACQ